jgi:hypothetical protein
MFAARANEGRQRMEERLPPVTGKFPPDDQTVDRPPEIPAHEGFDKAWEDAIKQAEKAWHPQPGKDVQVWATVEYSARIDIWNPGGIGQYHVKITPS